MYIAVFTPKNSIDMIESIIECNNFKNQFKCFEYSDLVDINNIYLTNKNDISGILFTGLLTEIYFMSEFPDCDIPICHIAHSQEACYIYLMKVLEEDRSLSLNQIYCDFIIQEKHYSLLKDIIPENLAPKTTKIKDMSKDIFNLLSDEITNLYESKKIKKAIVLSTNVYERLVKRNIPCEIVKIRKVDIEQSLYKIIESVSFNNLNINNNLIAFIDYSFEDDPVTDFLDIEYKEATLMKLLVDYKKSLNRGEELNIVRSTGMIEISYITTSRYNSTNYNSFYPIYEYILENFHFDFSIGIGVDKNIGICRKNAYVALDLSKDFGSKYAFVVKDSLVIGPIDKENCISFDISLIEESDKMSKKLNTSKMNYIRVTSLFREKTNYITSDMIAKCLNISVRSANRILKSMIENNLIQEVSLSKDNALKKGRPVKYYNLIEKYNFCDY